MFKFLLATTERLIRERPKVLAAIETMSKLYPRFIEAVEAFLERAGL